MSTPTQTRLPPPITERHDALPALGAATRRQIVDAHDPPAGRYLVVQEGEIEQLVAIESDVVRIGRGFTSDVRLEDTTVSRRHAIIATAGGRVRILDDRSVNGTFVNGRSVADAELRDGDVIVLGSVILGYREVR